MTNFSSTKLTSYFKGSLSSLPSFPGLKKNFQTPKENCQYFTVYLLRGKKLFSYLYSIDPSNSSKIRFELCKKIDIEIPLTVISDNRVDDEDELAEYFADIVDFFDIGSAPSLLLLDPSYFYNLFIEGELLPDLNVNSYSPFVASDTIYSIDRSSSDYTNLSFSSVSLLNSWAKCLSSIGSDCAYFGSYLYPAVELLSKQYDSFGVLDINNSSSNLLLFSSGKIISKNLPFGINQYLNGGIFLAQEFANRLSKSIVKASSDSAFTTPQDIFVISEYSLDSVKSKFFNIRLIPEACPPIHMKEGNLASGRSISAPTTTDYLSESLVAISLSSLSLIV